MPPRPPNAPAPGPRRISDNNAAPLIGRPSMMSAEERQAILKAQREAALRRRNRQLRMAKVENVEPDAERSQPPPPPPPLPPHVSKPLKVEKRCTIDDDEPKKKEIINREEEEEEESSSFAESAITSTFAPSPPSPRFSSSSEVSLSEDEDDASREEIAVAPGPVRIGKPASSTMQEKAKSTSKSTPSSLQPSSTFSIDSLGLNDTDAMRAFLTSPCPKEAGTLECYVRRHKSGAKKSLFPEYRVYLKEGDIFLLTSKKRKNKKTPNYLISMGRNDFDKNSRNVVGKLRANFIGTEFQIYDDGRNPNNRSGSFDERSDASIRSELGAVVFSSNLIGNRGPRQMQVCINKIDKNTGESTKMWQPAHRDEEMVQCFKHRVPAALRHLVVLENKVPQWNQELGAHVLNFNGRVTQASVKNFQLIEKNSGTGNNKDEEKSKVVLQFGRVAKSEFTLDFCWPMSPLQAFAIALSSCDVKLACD